MRNYEQMEQIFFNRAVEYGIFTRDENKEESITNEGLCRIFYLTAQKINIQLDKRDFESSDDTSILEKFINLKIIDNSTKWYSAGVEKANFTLLNDLDSSFFKIRELSFSSLEFWDFLKAIYGPSFFPTNYRGLTKGMASIAVVNLIDKHVADTINKFIYLYKKGSYEEGIRHLVDYITPDIVFNNVHEKFMALAYILRNMIQNSTANEITENSLLLLQGYMGIQDIFEKYFEYNPSRKDGIPSRIYHYTSLQT